MRTLIASVVAALVLAGPVAVAPTAHAEDQRPCVSRREFLGMKWLTRKQTEKRWDVVGLGHLYRYSGHPAWAFWQYPMCGYSYGEAFITTSVRRGNHQMIAAMPYWYDGATLHGHK